MNCLKKNNQIFIKVENMYFSNQLELVILTFTKLAVLTLVVTIRLCESVISHELLPEAMKMSGALVSNLGNHIFFCTVLWGNFIPFLILVNFPPVKSSLELNQIYYQKRQKQDTLFPKLGRTT